MAHPAQIQFCKSVKERFPERFRDCSVLDIGSLDVNGNNRYLFEGDYKYIGLDIGPGSNVDVVSPGHLYVPESLFDIVISTECFEHDLHYSQTIINAVDCLKPAGLLLFTCATTGRPEHGTTRSNTQWASPHSHILFDEYYKNLAEKDIRETVGIDLLFSQYQFSVNSQACDLYFWGIKK